MSVFNTFSYNFIIKIPNFCSFGAIYVEEVYKIALFSFWQSDLGGIYVYCEDHIGCFSEITESKLTIIEVLKLFAHLFQSKKLRTKLYYSKLH